MMDISLTTGLFTGVSEGGIKNQNENISIIENNSFVNISILTKNEG